MIRLTETERILVTLQRCKTKIETTPNLLTIHRQAYDSLSHAIYAMAEIAGVDAAGLRDDINELRPCLKPGDMQILNLPADPFEETV